MIKTSNSETTFQLLYSEYPIFFPNMKKTVRVATAGTLHNVHPGASRGKRIIQWSKVFIKPERKNRTRIYRMQIDFFRTLKLQWNEKNVVKGKY